VAVKIRLTRIGKHKRPFYRIVAADSQSPRDGKFIENLGTYDPLAQENGVHLKEEKIISWINQGAQVSDTVKSIFKRHQIFSKIQLEKVVAKEEPHKQ